MKNGITKKTPITLLLVAVLVCFITPMLNAQYLIVNSGSFFVNDSANLSLHETSIENNAGFETDPFAVVHISGSEEVIFSGSTDIEISNLSIENNIVLNTNLSITDNLHMNGGNLNLSDKNLNLYGQIIGEKDESRIFSTGFGEVLTTSTSPASNNGNIGLSVAYENGRSVAIARGHMVSSTESYNSISRYYTINPADDNINFTFNYLSAEIGDLDENLLTPWYEFNGNWFPVSDFTLNTDSRQVTATVFSGFDKITLFASEFEDVSIASGFSPNGDGMNDFFMIEGVERYPNNKLIVFNQWGEIVYEASPYYNDWSGISENRLTKGNDSKLLDGTYYYFFFKERNNKNSVSKGFVELKNNTN